ncbi:hypothetical protein [Agromyces laixinhei]|uniref:hypothetical protein n=1 Tax=Agromyces laixinhei TaxID=2585717 RepID=UPI0012ECDA76|nr:hypothetical protein [Agromyces laixinhei]
MTGGVVALIGGIVTAIYVFQPWRTCAGEDSSAGCAMLPQDGIVMAIAMIATLCGIVVFVVGLALSRSKTTR